MLPINPIDTLSLLNSNLLYAFKFIYPRSLPACFKMFIASALPYDASFDTIGAADAISVFPTL